MVQRQGPQPKKASKAKIDALVLKLKARMMKIMFDYNKLAFSYKESVLGQMLPIPDAGKVHEALAFLFLANNPRAKIKSMNADVVGIDVTGFTEWNNLSPGELVWMEKAGRFQSHGEHLVQRYGRPIFITGPGTVWFTKFGVASNPDSYKEFLRLQGHCKESDVLAVMDSHYKRLGQYLATIGEGHEAPILVQFIADLNPLTSIAKIVEWINTGKNLYTGKPMSDYDKFSASIGLAGGVVGIFGKFVTQALGISKGMSTGAQLLFTTPGFGQVSWLAAQHITKDKIAQEIFEEIIEVSMDMTLDKVVSSSQPKK